MTETEENRLAAQPLGGGSGMISKHTPEGVCFYASPACRSLLGYDPDDLVGRSLRELVHPEDGARFEEFFSRVAASRDACVVAYRAARKDGTRVWLETTGSAMRDPDTGGVREIVAISREAAGTRTGGSSPKAPTGVALVDLRTGRLVESDPVLREMLAYSEDELRDVDLGGLTHPEDPAAGAELRQRLLAGELGSYQAENRYVRRDGGAFWGRLTVSPVRDVAGPPRYAVGKIEDLTGSRPAQNGPRITRISEEIYRAVVEHVAENIFVVDVETGRILESNAAFNRSLGYSLEEIQDLTLYDLVAHERGGIDRNIRLVLERGSLDVGERKYRRADGTLLDVEVKVSVVPYGGGRALCVVAHDVTGRKRAEEALRRSEERLRTISETEPECVKVLDARGRLLEMNRAGLAMIEADSLEQVRGRPVNDLVLPAYRERFVALHQRVLGGGSGRLEFELVGLKGTHRWLETNAVPLRDSDGGIVGQLSVTRDVSARKRAEEELRMSEMRFRMLVEQSPLSIQILDPDGRTLRVNRAWERLWGVKLEQISGYNVLHDAQLIEKGVVAYIRRALAGESVAIPPIKYEPDVSVPDVSDVPHRWVRAFVYPIQDESGGVREVALIHEDITERLRAEEELREGHALLESVIEGTADAVFVKDLEGRYLLVNAAAARITGGPGRTVGDIVGRDDTELFPPEVARNLMELDRIVMETGEVRVAEEVVPLDGEDRTMLSTKLPYRDHRGEVVGMIGVSTDITERKQAERTLFEIREAERGRIARDLHDTVLHHIVGVLQTMQVAQIEDPDPREDLAWQVDALRGAVKGLRGAIYDLRPERREPLARSLQSLVDLNRHLAPGCEFVLTVEEEQLREPPETAKVELVRIVQEALTNARRHSGAGRIEVRLGGGADGDLLAEVSDDGRGFDPEAVLSGVGLSTMRERAAAAGARLVVESGRGTRVRVSVPLEDGPGRPGPEASERSRMPGRTAGPGASTGRPGLRSAEED